MFFEAFLKNQSRLLPPKRALVAKTTPNRSGHVPAAPLEDGAGSQVGLSPYGHAMYLEDPQKTHQKH